MTTIGLGGKATWLRRNALMSVVNVKDEFHRRDTWWPLMMDTQTRERDRKTSVIML
jgi:hypothetical protein